MQQEVAKLAEQSRLQNAEGVLQTVDNKSVDTSTRLPERPADSVQEGATGSSAQDKFYKTTSSLVEVMKEQESGGSALKWERKAPVIKA